MKNMNTQSVQKKRGIQTIKTAYRRKRIRFSKRIKTPSGWVVPEKSIRFLEKVFPLDTQLLEAALGLISPH